MQLRRRLEAPVRRPLLVARVLLVDGALLRREGGHLFQDDATPRRGEEEHLFAVVRGDLPVCGRPEDDVRDAERSRQELHVRQHVALALRQDARRRLEVGRRFRQDHDLVT